VGRRWPRVRRAATLGHPRLLVLGDGNDSSGNQRAAPPGRPNKRDRNAHKDRAGGKDKPGKGK
jgi:hypothetical protein